MTGHEVDSNFIKHVSDYMPRKLPRPVKKEPIMEDGKIIPIISITCEGEEW